MTLSAGNWNKEALELVNRQVLEPVEGIADF